MIIIGLLIAGVLKGQALITNAQVAAAVSQLKGVDAATTSFRDAYNYKPGDLPSPTTRLPGCTTGNVCGATAGDGDGILTGNAPGAKVSGEGLQFFPQLAAASLLTGLNFQATACSANWGDCYPAVRIGGGLNPGWSTGGAAFAASVGTPTASGIESGVFMALAQQAGAAMSTTAGSVPLTPNQAKRMDDKMDDGIPTTGIVLAGGASSCVTGTGGTAIYQETVTTKACGLFAKIQN